MPDHRAPRDASAPEALAVLDTARAIAIALVRDGVLFNAELEGAHRDAIERWGRLIVLGERIVKVPDA
jgi:hypothetical protein